MMNLRLETQYSPYTHDQNNLTCISMYSVKYWMLNIFLLSSLKSIAIMQSTQYNGVSLKIIANGGTYSNSVVACSLFIKNREFWPWSETTEKFINTYIFFVPLTFANLQNIRLKNNNLNCHCCILQKVHLLRRVIYLFNKHCLDIDSLCLISIHHQSLNM